MKIWIVTYDWGSYGSGIVGVYSSKTKAEAVVASKASSFGSYDIEEYTVDQE